jgi:DNA invertase Pin-like site-specific DNA recombinase
MAIAIGYIRRSKESEGRTVSLEVQEASIRTYAASRGMQVATVVVDDGISGGDRSRFARIAETVRDAGAQAVIVYHLDRFARDLAGMLDTLSMFAKKGVSLLVVNRGKVEVSSASGFLTASVEGLIAEHYRRVVSEKTKDALARLKSVGKRHTRIPPFGFRFQDNRLVEQAEEQRAIRAARLLSQEGLSVRVIAKRLTEQGYRARNGQTFAPSTVHRIVHMQS